MQKLLAYFSNKLNNFISLLDDIFVIKTLVYINLLIILSNALSFFTNYKLITVDPVVHYSFFFFSTIVVVRYIQKNF
jgi:hypothetical protein